MKHALLLFLLIGISLEDDVDQGYYELMNNFITGASEFPAPEKLARGVFTKDLVLYSSYYMSEMLQDFLLEYYQQASRAKNGMIRDMKNSVERLTELFIRSTIPPEDDMKRVNNLLEKLLKCLPGNVKIKRKALPPLPPPNQVETHLGNEELSSLYLDLAGRIDRDLKSIRDLVDGVLLSGWEKARLSFNKVQDQLREDHLNPMLWSFSAEINKINDKEAIIKQHVTNDTWQAYRELNQRVNSALQSL
ncbi:uncharacterized protein LOC123265080 [Cotesia glomerata]|uniref:Uncharacterized protein n=1 Tax=Cotesia glomerata TaxID=32391 RepID=A0AAV7IXA3_COTGL|nr:uncharacterized protein LOC123265080 [Cotesia glomerata]KAH0560379.1 hypothetical protein KQX54_004072 [Cotesia glomerata]